MPSFRGRQTCLRNMRRIWCEHRCGRLRIVRFEAVHVLNDIRGPRLLYVQSACGCRHSEKSVVNNKLLRIHIGRPPVSRMRGLCVHSPSLRLQIFVHVPVKEHVFHRVHAVKRPSPDRHTRSRQVRPIPPCSSAPERCHIILFVPVRCACTHDITVFVVFGGILAPLGCMRPSRAHRSGLR